MRHGKILIFAQANSRVSQVAGKKVTFDALSYRE